MTPAAALTAPVRREFALRRLHSLTGIVPIGIYLVVHILLENTFVLGGAKRFEIIPQFFDNFPWPVIMSIEILVIWAPLAFHGIYGLLRVTQAELDNPLHNDWFTAYLYSMQRITGVIAFLFVGYHVWSTRIQYYLGNAEITYAFMHAKMIDPLIFAVYVIGVLSSVFHFTNGIWTFCVTWGITVGQQAQVALRRASLLFFVFMGGTAVAILVAFRV